MGWWNQTKEGESFATDDSLLWGDGPADVFDNAIREIVAQFEDKGYGPGRRPLKQEIVSGLMFSLSIYDDEEVKA